MAIITCPDCSKEISDSAPACPNCGRPSNEVSRPKTVPDFKGPNVRPVGFMLGLGILLLPIVFAWFTLGKGRTTRAKVLAFGYLAISIMFFSMQSGSSSNSTAPTASPTVKPATEQIMAVGIDQVLSDYKGNEVAADNRYKGRLIQVTGAVGDIKKDFTNNLYVTLGTGELYEIPKIQAFFDDSMNQQLGNLRKGQKLTVVCRVKGLMMNVLAEDCVIK